MIQIYLEKYLFIVILFQGKFMLKARISHCYFQFMRRSHGSKRTSRTSGPTGTKRKMADTNLEKNVVWKLSLFYFCLCWQGKPGTPGAQGLTGPKGERGERVSATDCSITFLFVHPWRWNKMMWSTFGSGSLRLPRGQRFQGRAGKPTQTLTSVFSIGRILITIFRT